MQLGKACSLNFVYLVLGVFGLGCICWSLACIIPFRELYGNGFTLPQILFFVFVVFALGFAIVGIIGNHKRSHKLTLSFCVFIILLSIIFVLIAVIVILELVKLAPVLEGRMFRLYVSYNDSTDDDIFDDIQQDFGCCGFYNYTDWFYNETNHLKHLSQLVPASCCQATPSRRSSVRNEICRSHSAGRDYLRTRGCKSKGYERAIQCVLPIIIAAFLIAIVGIPCCVLSFLESNRMKHESEDEDDEDAGDDEDNAEAEGVEDEEGGEDEEGEEEEGDED